MNVSQAAMLVLAIIAIFYLILKFGRALGAILVILCLLCASAWALVHSFTTFSEQTLVAQVHASPVENQPHTMIVDLTTYDSYGNPVHSSYEVGGDRWLLQAQVVEFQPWVLFMGVRSGYHLSRIEGQFDSDTADSTPVQLGSWNFFNSLENNVGLFFPVVKSAYSSAVIDPAGTYNVYADPQGDLSATRA